MSPAIDVTEDPLAVQQRIGYLPENAPVYADMHVQEFLRFVAEMRGLDAGAARRRMLEAIEQCAVGEVLTRTIGHLSKGYRQRVGLAAAILHDPEILILDEPTSGLDPNQIVEVRELIRRMGQTKTVILSTHILPEVEASCEPRRDPDRRPDPRRRDAGRADPLAGPRSSASRRTTLPKPGGCSRGCPVSPRSPRRADGGFHDFRLSSPETRTSARPSSRPCASAAGRCASCGATTRRWSRSSAS